MGTEFYPEKANALEIALGLKAQSAVELFHKIPKTEQTPEMVRLAVEKDAFSIRNVAENLLTSELCEMAVRQNAKCLKNIPEGFITASLCEAAVNRDASAIEFVPEHLYTESMGKHAVSQDGMLLKYVPQEQRTKWLAIFAECEGFYKKYGDLEFPANFRGKTDVDLRDWLSRNRQKFHAGELSEEFAEKLKSIGAFEKHTDWKQCFDACKRYFKKYGNLEFSDDFCCNDGINLKAWLQLNQERAAADMLPDRRKRQLASIGAWVDETQEFVVSMSGAQKEEFLENAKASGFSDMNAYLRSLLGLEKSRR